MIFPHTQNFDREEVQKEQWRVAEKIIKELQATLPGGGPPTGAASGDLSGSYPGPTIANNAITSAKIADGTITDADINPTAAIDATKLGSGTVDNTELGYLNGVSSPIQTQFAASQPLNSNLTEIATATFANDDIPQKKGGLIVNRTLAQLWTDLTGIARTIAGTITFSNPPRLPNGTNSLPALTWATETASGWYRKSANAFGFAIATNDVFTVFANLINAKVPFYAEAGLVYGELYIDNSMSPYDLEMTDPRFVKIDTTAGAVEVILPSNTDSTGPQEFTFIDVGLAYGGTGFATNNFTITPDGSETIDGAADRTLNTNRAAVTIIPDVNSLDWAVISER